MGCTVDKKSRKGRIPSGLETKARIQQKLWGYQITFVILSCCRTEQPTRDDGGVDTETSVATWALASLEPIGRPRDRGHDTGWERREARRPKRHLPEVPMR